MRRFDPDANTQAECAALRTFALGLRNGDVVLAGIAYSAVPPGVTMASTLMAPCLEGLNRFGARRALEIGPSQAWALVGIVGAAANLAEAVGGLREQVQVSAELLLDADRDGLTDALDADNDNDGVTDSVERVNGTDILDLRPAL
jgi:hypothetical protein